MGPILLCVNPYRDVGNPLTLNSTRSLPLDQQLNRVVQEAVRQQSETGYPQAIILSGRSACFCLELSLWWLVTLKDGTSWNVFGYLDLVWVVLWSRGTFLFSGTSGSGKSHVSMLLLRQLFAVAGGGPETDAFKHLAAAFTVLRSLGSAKTATNSESSRIVSFSQTSTCLLVLS